MYISEFWCGVLATLGVEIVTFFIWGIFIAIKDN